MIPARNFCCRVAIRRISQRAPPGARSATRAERICCKGDLGLGLEPNIIRYPATVRRTESSRPSPLADTIGKAIGKKEAALMGGHRQAYRRLAVVLLAQLATQYCRATPTEWLPFFGKPVSSMIQAWTGSSRVIDGSAPAYAHGSPPPDQTTRRLRHKMQQRLVLRRDPAPAQSPPPVVRRFCAPPGRQQPDTVVLEWSDPGRHDPALMPSLPHRRGSVLPSPSHREDPSHPSPEVRDLHCYQTVFASGQPQSAAWSNILRCSVGLEAGPKLNGRDLCRNCDVLADGAGQPSVNHRHLREARDSVGCDSLVFASRRRDRVVAWTGSTQLVSARRRAERRYHLLSLRLMPASDQWIGSGGRSRTRTYGPLIKSQLLYQLSYAPAGPSTRIAGPIASTPRIAKTGDCKDRCSPRPAIAKTGDCQGRRLTHILACAHVSSRQTAGRPLQSQGSPGGQKKVRAPRGFQVPASSSRPGTRATHRERKVPQKRANPPAFPPPLTTCTPACPGSSAEPRAPRCVGCGRERAPTPRASNEGCGGRDKPHREQDRIGAAGGMGRSPTSPRGRGGVPASSSGLVA